MNLIKRLGRINLPSVHRVGVSEVLLEVALESGQLGVAARQGILQDHPGDELSAGRSRQGAVVVIERLSLEPHVFVQGWPHLANRLTFRVN